MQKENKANQKNTRKRLEEQRRKLITNKERTKEQKEGITRCVSPSPRPIKHRTTKRSNATSLPNYLCPQMSANYAPSINMTLSTSKLNFICLTSASPANSTNQGEYLKLFLVRPTKPQNKAPQLMSPFTMKQQMIHSLPTTTTHNTPINKIKIPTP